MKLNKSSLHDGVRWVRVYVTRSFFNDDRKNDFFWRMRPVTSYRHLRMFCSEKALMLRNWKRVYRENRRWGCGDDT